MALAACGGAPDERPPDVLLVTIDTLRADHLGHYGYERNTSPHMDAFANASVIFENAHSSSSWTLPGLASMLTGEHSSTHGCWSLGGTPARTHTSTSRISWRICARGTC